MKKTINNNETNRPLRTFDKILRGGLQPGNLGLVMSRHGTGGVAVMTAIAIDHAMNGVNTLHAVYGKSIDAIRAYDDEVLHEILVAYDIKNRAEVMTCVERHKQIYTYASGSLSAKRLRRTIEFLIEHAQFRPHHIEIQGWPDFETVTEDEIRALKGLAVEFHAEVWLLAHTHRDEHKPGTVPAFVERFDPWISVMIGLEPEAEHVNMRFLKTHDFSPPDGVHLEFDPKTMLIRWR